MSETFSPVPMSPAELVELANLMGYASVTTVVPTHNDQVALIYNAKFNVRQKGLTGS